MEHTEFTDKAQEAIALAQRTMRQLSQSQLDRALICGIFPMEIPVATGGMPA